MQRLTMRPMRFRAAEGLTLPADTNVVGALLPRHLDPEVYERPREFDPWRFVGERYTGDADEGDAKTRGYLFVNTSIEFLQFGHGKHAWCVRRAARLVASADARRVAPDGFSRRSG